MLGADWVSIRCRSAMAVGFARSWQTLLTGLLLVGMVGLAAHVILDLKREAWRQAADTGRNVSATLQKEIGRTLALYDLSLRGAAATFGDPALAGANLATRQSAPFDRSAETEHLGVVLVADESGRVTYSSVPVRPGLSLRGQPYFTAGRESADRGLQVLGPLASLLFPGERILALSRPLAHPDGSFAGAVVGAIRLSYFADLFSALNLGLEGSITLLGEDGTIIFRAPSPPDGIGADTTPPADLARLRSGPQGSFIGAPAADGERRLDVFRQIGGYPLIVEVGLATRDIDGRWIRQGLTIGGLMLALCGIALALILQFGRELGKRLAAEQRQAALAAEYRLLSDNTADMITRFDRDFRRVFVSPACERLLGYAQSELIGELPGGIVHPDHWLELDAGLNAPLRSGAQQARAIYLGLRKDGSTLWLESAGRRLPDGSGYVVVTRDISDRVAIEAQLQEANARLVRLASRDGLTGLLNRRAFDEALEREFRRCAAEQAPGGLVLLDVDWFKVFNDRYGHPEGDECLRRVAQAVRSSVGNAAELCARYGGEELAVILPGSDLADTLAVAEAIRVAVVALRIPHASSPFGQVTVSVGVSGMQAGPDAALTGELLLCADRALYRAKFRGRNQVIGSAATAGPLGIGHDAEPIRQAG